MEITNRFSLEDFLAYLFPGLLATFGLYLFLFLTPFATVLTNLLEGNALTALLFILAISYALGNILAAASETIYRGSADSGAAWQIKSRIPLPGRKEELIQAYKDHFNITDPEFEWTLSDFYICRSLVLGLMPGVAAGIQRQNSLRQYRMALISVLALWALLGILGGFQIARAYDATSLGVQISLISFAFWLDLTILVWRRMDRHEERETREVLAAFIAGFHSGAFNGADDNDEAT